MQEADVVVIGAGAAGVGAGMALAARGVPFVIVEAADRVGGRAFTDKTSLPFTWDQGCHWLHCADVNPLVAYAERLGADFIRQERGDHYMAWAGGAWANKEELAQLARAIKDAFVAIYGSAKTGRDVPISDALPKGSKWQRNFEYYTCLMAAEDADKVSASGYADYEDTGVDWPVISGLGDLVERMGTGLPIRLGVAAKAVRETRDGVTVETSQGDIRARAVVVTTSTNVLQSGAIRFESAGAAAMLDLMQATPCGIYEKAAIALKRLPSEFAGKLFATVDLGGAAAPLDFQIDSRGQPFVIGHFAGSLARDLVARDGLVDFALERLGAAFGADFLNEVDATAATTWQANPLTQGGYSFTLAGRAEERRAMIALDTGPVRFAGEVFSPKWQATAHGAWQSGQDAVGTLVAQGLAG